MQITKARLKQIIKEELDASKQKEQVNEIGGLSGMLGIDPSTLSDTAMVLLSFLDMAVNLSPAVIAGAAGAYFGDKSAKNASGYEITRAHREKARKLSSGQFKQELENLKKTRPEEAEAIEKAIAQKRKDAEEILSDLGPQRQSEQMMEQEKVAADVARVGKKLDTIQGLDKLLASINTRVEFEQLMLQLIQMVAKERLNPNDVKVGVRNVNKAVSQSR